MKNASIRRDATVAAVVGCLVAIGPACLPRPAGHADPMTKTNVVLSVPNEAVDKIDMLFDIDNSASMGDKQYFFTQAIPDLIDRLINPNCVDNLTGAAVASRSVAGAGCPPGSKAEFPPVHDMHVGIVSSSLGQRLSEPDPTGNKGVCFDPLFARPPFDNLNAHMDDKGHLIGRSIKYAGANGATATEGVVAEAVNAAYGMAPSGFLYWFPNAAGATGSATPIADRSQLENDFTDLVTGVGTFGCGIESQLESWYRFLVQPDPYDTLTIAPNPDTTRPGTAQWQGVDGTILKERHDFLRPDSLVVIVVLSDENDSEIDVRSIGGLGYLFMQTEFLPPHGTSPCANSPLDPGCHSCSTSDKNDPSCLPAPAGQDVQRYTSLTDWGRDANLRHVHMRAKYGLDPQYPIERYFLGLTSTTVPDRAHEYPPGFANYQGLSPANRSCVNPLFAKDLPDGKKTDADTLCNLTAGGRTLDKIFYAHIGGGPHQLLHFTPGDPAASLLSAQDWIKILGNDPLHYDYTGIDPHMIESYKPRPGLAAPGSASTTDPISGREWITDQVLDPKVDGHVIPIDRQYACTFKLPLPRDCTLNYNSAYRCDCPSMPGVLSHEQTPSVCDDKIATTQLSAKAYPTIRELLLAKLMGTQGVVSSICPQETADPTSPVYGYRPAVAAIIDRLKAALLQACLPRKLNVDACTQRVPCLILVTLPPRPGESCLNPTCDAKKGLTVPDADTLRHFCASQEAAQSDRSVCVLAQLPPMMDCSNSPDPGWCYVEGGRTGCAQAIAFSSMSPPPGSLTTLACIETNVSVVDCDGGR